MPGGAALLLGFVLIVLVEKRVEMQWIHALKWISSGEWSCSTSVWVIWNVALMVCSKQLLCVSFYFFSFWWTKQQLLSVVGLFTPSIHFSACPFSCLGDGKGVRCRLQSFSSEIAWVIHLVEYRWIHKTFWSSLHKEEKYDHWPKQTDIFSSQLWLCWEVGFWIENKSEIEGDRGKKGCVTKCVVGNLRSGLRSVGRKWKTLVYETFILSWHDIDECLFKSNQGGDMAKYCSHFTSRKKWKWVKR